MKRKQKHRRIKRLDRWYRRPSNQKYKKLPGIRPGARPPDSRDEIPTDRIQYGVRRHIEAMIKKGWDRDKMATKVEAKWGMKKHIAFEWVDDYIEWAEDNSAWLTEYRQGRRKRRYEGFKAEMIESWENGKPYDITKSKISFNTYIDRIYTNKIIGKIWKEWLEEKKFFEHERFRYMKKGKRKNNGKQGHTRK